MKVDPSAELGLRFVMEARDRLVVNKVVLGGLAANSGTIFVGDRHRAINGEWQTSLEVAVLRCCAGALRLHRGGHVSQREPAAAKARGWRGQQQQRTDAQGADRHALSPCAKAVHPIIERGRARRRWCVPTTATAGRPAGWPAARWHAAAATTCAAWRGTHRKPRTNPRSSAQMLAVPSNFELG